MDKSGNINLTWVNDTAKTALPPLSVSVSTDQEIYTPGDLMKVTININNPSANSVVFEQYAIVPQKSLTKLIKKMTVPSGNTTTLTTLLTVGNWSSKPFGALWYVHLLNSTSGDILAQDNTMWIYTPSPIKLPLKPTIEFPI